MRKNILTILVALQSIIIGLWLMFHHGKINYTDKIKGFEHMEFFNTPAFYLAVIFVGILLIYAVLKNKTKIQRWTLVFMNAIWASYTISLFINELNGVPNMSWSLFLGYNVAIYLAARYEVNV